MTTLSQVDAGYNAQQDRILLRITNKTGEEYRLWLTRRICLTFLTDFKARTSTFRITGGSGSVHSHDKETAVLRADLEQKAAVANKDFATRFKSGNRFPLGQDGLVVETINLKPDGKGEGVHGLSLHDAAGRGITLGVSVDLFNSIFEIVERVVAQADWAIELSAATRPENAILQ